MKGIAFLDNPTISLAGTRITITIFSLSIPGEGGIRSNIMCMLMSKKKICSCKMELNDESILI